jgi:catechol 2,3-dioxygenase-like lactoylglutathione lyase family enzyme
VNYFKEMNMIDHIGFGVADFAKAKAFYSAALVPLGISLQMEVTPEMTGGSAHAGFGVPDKPFFWIGTGKHSEGLHVAFAAANRATVDAFYSAAMAAGGKDNGAPGLRPHYHPNYYAAFVIDLDGNNIEAVCHMPE